MTQALKKSVHFFSIHMILDNNNISGSIPMTIGNLKNLQLLLLGKNDSNCK